MQLSVLSALARLGLDPWQEAANLALQPGTSATKRLTCVLAELPDEPSIHRDHASIAARLVALLPSQARSKGGRAGIGEAFDVHSTLRMLAVNVLFVVFMLGAQWLISSHQVPSQKSDAVAMAHDSRHQNVKETKQ